MNSNQRRGSNWLFPAGAAVSMVVAAQTGCMPDFDVISSEWHPTSGAAGKAGQGSSSAGSSGQSAQGGTSNGGTSNGGMSSGGTSNGGRGHGGTGARPNQGGTGGTGAVGPGPAGEGGVENAGNGGANEGGAAAVGGTSGSSGTGGTGGSSGTSAAGGEAGAMCDPGFTTCPGSDACVTNLSNGTPSGSTFTDCGTCGVTCSTINATSVACTSGACHSTCASNFADCNGAAANDGCEADLTSLVTCGDCNHPCSKAGATTRACTTGKCVPTCGAGYADCTLDDGTTADDGCETFLDSLSSCATACTGGVACSPDQVCNAGVCGAASGLVRMTIPFTGASQGQRYADVFAQQTDLMPDLTGATVTVRMYAPGAAGGTVSAYIADGNIGSPDFSPFTTIDFETLSAGWTDIVVPVPSTSGFDSTHIHQLTLDFHTGVSTANPTVVYVDRVWSSNLLVKDTFDTSAGTVVASSLLTIGGTFDWVAAVP